MSRSVLLKIGALSFAVIFLLQLFSYVLNSNYAASNLHFIPEIWNNKYAKTNVILQLNALKLSNKTESIVYSYNKSCTEHFPASLSDRLSLLLRMKTDGATEESLHRLGLPYYTSSIKDLVVPQYVQDKIQVKIPTIVCAASSNHFGELQALIRHIDTNIRRYFPHIKVVIYDIGLSESEIKVIKKYGKAEYRLFNFDIYPPHFRKHHLHAWKPVIIQEILREVGYAMYMDTSVRPHGDQLQKHFDLAERTGHVFRTVSSNQLSFHTLAGTFPFFNVPVCVFHGLAEIESGHILVRRDNLISLIIMRSFLACILQKDCVMPVGAEKPTGCSYPKHYHHCHRDDQSVLGISIYIVYQDYFKVPFFDRTSFDTKRGEQSKYLITGNITSR